MSDQFPDTGINDNRQVIDKFRSVEAIVSVNINGIKVNDVLVEAKHGFNLPTTSISAIDFEGTEIRFGFKNDQSKLVQFGKELIFGIGSFLFPKGYITNLLFICTARIAEGI